jgi:hypothetical protein
MEVEYIVFNGEKITDLRKIKEKWKEYNGITANIFHGVLHIKFSTCCMTKLIFSESNLPKNKKIKIDTSIKNGVRDIACMIINDVGVIKLFDQENNYRGNEIPPEIRLSSKFVTYIRSRTFDDLYFRGEKIKDLSVIRNFCQENNFNVKFGFHFSENRLNVELNYNWHQCAVIFIDEQDESKKFTIYESYIATDGVKKYITYVFSSSQSKTNIIFRGNKKIELVKYRYFPIGPNDEVYELDEGHKKVDAINQRVHN